MALLDRQARAQQIGKIRLGERKATSGGGERPVRLEKFRFTSPSRGAIDKVAEIWGGTVRPWEHSSGPQWEVYTDAWEIEVVVPPFGAISQWYEMWTAGGCQRRCDGRTETLENRACLCPEDLDVRAELARRKVPAACKPHTRVNLILPDIPGVGVWTLESNGDNAADELGMAAQVLDMAGAGGRMVPATLRMETRKRMVRNEPRQYVVPVLQITRTLRELAAASGAQEVLSALGPATGSVPAVTAAPAEPEAAPEAAPEALPQALGEGTPAQRALAIAEQAMQVRAAGLVVTLRNVADAAGLLAVQVPENLADEASPTMPLDEFLRLRYVAMNTPNEHTDQRGGAGRG
jgi:hypothetical protein